jgi:hypothetical protein
MEDAPQGASSFSILGHESIDRGAAPRITVSPCLVCPCRLPATHFSCAISESRDEDVP